MTNIQDRAKRIQEIVATQNILKDSEHEQVKSLGSDLMKTAKTWEDKGIDHSTFNIVGFGYFLKSLAETHSIEDINTVVEVAFNLQQQSNAEEQKPLRYRDNYDQVADDLYACMDRWQDAGIFSFFALTVSLDIIASELRELLPAADAEEVIQDYINLRKGDV